MASARHVHHTSCVVFSQQNQSNEIPFLRARGGGGSSLLPDLLCVFAFHLTTIVIETAQAKIPPSWYGYVTCVCLEFRCMRTSDFVCAEESFGRYNFIRLFLQIALDWKIFLGLGENSLCTIFSQL
jgi:hypothetical protein